MVRKKRLAKKSKKFNISNRLSYTIIAVVALVLVVAGVYAYGTLNPPVFGHTPGEIDPGVFKPGTYYFSIISALRYNINGMSADLFGTSNGLYLTNENGEVFINTGGSTPGLTIKGNNLGVGTTNPATKLHVAGGLRLDSSIITDPLDTTLTSKYLSINLDGIPYLIPLYVRTGVIGGSHTSAQCTSAGGSVISVAGGDICRFNTVTCPSGWTQYQSWSTTVDKTCTESSYDPNCPGTNDACTTGSHLWSNTAVEECFYDILTQGYPACTSASIQCTATVFQVGCY